LTQNNTFSHLTTKFSGFYFFPSILLAVTGYSKGFGRLYKIPGKIFCDSGVDYGGKAVDSVGLRQELRRNTKRLTLFYGCCWLFWYTINKKAWNKP
jgi:hypothetical protein